MYDLLEFSHTINVIANIGTYYTCQTDRIIHRRTSVTHLNMIGQI